MKLRTLLAPAGLIVVASLVLAFAACGGDDSSSKNSSSNNSGGANSTSSAKTTTSSNGSSDAGTGGDEQYISSLCKAMVKFQDSVTKVTSDPSKLTDATAISKAFTGPFETLVSDLKAAKPPKDMKDYHDQVVAQFSKAVDTLKKGGDLNSLSSLGDIPEPPQNVKDRLQKVADNNADCKKADINFNQ